MVMGAGYSFELKKVEIGAPAFFRHNNSSAATVYDIRENSEFVFS
jgi:hypothetical protein